MNGCRTWTFDKGQLDLVLSVWREQGATDVERSQVSDCILDVLHHPETRGDFDEELAVWVARAQGTNAVFVYELRDGCVIFPHRIGWPDGLHPFPVEPS